MPVKESIKSGIWRVDLFNRSQFPKVYKGQMATAAATHVQSAG